MNVFAGVNVLFVVIYLAFFGGALFVARKKGHSLVLMFIVCLFISPLLGLIGGLVLDKSQQT